MNFIGLRIILNRLRVIPFFLRDKTVPLRKKILMIFCIAYIVIPLDFAPVFPLDDFVLFLFVIIHLRDDLDAYWKGPKTEDFSKKFRDKDIVDGVKFSVDEEEGSDGNEPPAEDS